MNNINWKVRLQSGSWWMGIISAVVVAIFAILKICKVDVPVTADEVMNHDRSDHKGRVRQPAGAYIRYAERG